MSERNLPILRGKISKTGRQLAVYCPYCRTNHFHGWPESITNPGHLEHRICHCCDTLRRRAKDSPYREHGYLIGIAQDREHSKQFA